MIKYKTNAIIITGGLQNMNGSPFLAAKHSKETLIVDPTNKFEIEMGPPMNTERTLHVSGKMVINNIVYIVVVGGVNHCDVSDKDQTLDSVELLDPSSEQGWFYGKFFLRKKFYVKVNLSQKPAKKSLVPFFASGGVQKIFREL